MIYLSDTISFSLCTGLTSFPTQLRHFFIDAWNLYRWLEETKSSIMSAPPPPYEPPKVNDRRLLRRWRQQTLGPFLQLWAYMCSCMLSIARVGLSTHAQYCEKGPSKSLPFLLGYHRRFHWCHMFLFWVNCNGTPHYILKIKAWSQTNVKNFTYILVRMCPGR